VVCVYNDEKNIAACLKSLLNQTIPADHYEIIVVDDGSVDQSAHIIKKSQGIQCIYQNNQGPSAARNAGIKVAQGEMVAFTDSDCEVTKNWLENLKRVFIKDTSEKLAGVGGMQLGHPDDNDFAKSVDQFLCAIGFVGDYVKTHQQVKQVSHNASCNASYRTHILKKIGGFRHDMFPGEDVDLDKRLKSKGYTILFTPDAIVYHHRPTSNSLWKKMLINYGKASAHNLMIHGPFRIIQLLPIIFVLLPFILFSLFSWFDTGCVFLMMLFTFSAGIYCLKFRKNLSFFQTSMFVFQTVIWFSYGYYQKICHTRLGKSVQRDLPPIC
jgi:glycosyltransferase involved in cell wall biosynthesis